MNPYKIDNHKKINAMRKFIIVSIILAIMVSCSTTDFVQTSVVSWSSIPLRDNISVDEAWDEVIDVIAKKFEMELISKDGLYARTGWFYTWNLKGVYTRNYRNRVIIKFSPDKETVNVKAEAQYGKRGKWKNGFDSRLLRTIKQDIMGVVGRTTR